MTTPKSKKSSAPKVVNISKEAVPEQQDVAQSAQPRQQPPLFFGMMMDISSPWTIYPAGQDIQQIMDEYRSAGTCTTIAENGRLTTTRRPYAVGVFIGAELFSFEEAAAQQAAAAQEAIVVPSEAPDSAE